MKGRLLVSSAVLLALLSACSDKTPEAQDAEPGKLFGDQRRALEKAGEMEGMLEDARQQRDEAMESQAGP